MARTQTLVQFTEDLLAALDQYAAGAQRSRSEIIRAAVERYLHEEIESDIDRQIIAGYQRIPQTPDSWIDKAARESIAAEPW